MKREAYPVLPNKSLTRFYFKSFGPKGVIRKVITFRLTFPGVWNLAFGDMKAGSKQFDDNIVSDNSDMRLVLQTVANAVYAFTEKYPERRVYIEPVDEKRKNLYNLIFRKKLEEIRLFFIVEGIIFESQKMETYTEVKIYDAFVLTRKKSIFEN